MPMPASAEAHFIALCVREQDTLTPVELATAAARVRDWDEVVARSHRHRVTAFVSQALGRSHVEAREAVIRDLDRLTMISLTRVMLLEIQLQETLRELAEAAVPTIVLKGPALARTVYPEIGFRPYSDIDLTVPESCEEAAAAALMEAGFDEAPFEAEVVRRGRRRKSGCEAGYHRLFSRPGAQGQIELHLEPLQLGLKPACEDGRWRRAMKIPGLPSALMLSPEDQMVQLSVHALKHGFDRLIWLKDIDLLLRVYQQSLDWSLIGDIARREGVEAAVWYSLCLVHHLLNAPISPSGLADLRPSPVVRALFGMVWPRQRIANLDGFLRYRAVQFHAAQSWRGVLPSLVLMGRRGTRLRAIAHTFVHR